MTAKNKIINPSLMGKVWGEACGIKGSESISQGTIQIK